MYIILIKLHCQLKFFVFLLNLIKFSSLRFKNLNFGLLYQGAWSIVNFILYFFTCQTFYLDLHLYVLKEIRKRGDGIAGRIRSAYRDLGRKRFIGDLE